MDESFPVSETSVLEIAPDVYDAMCALALAEYPLEACGLLAGPAQPGHPTDRITHFFPCRNIEASARIYTIDPKDHLRAERRCDDLGLEIRGVMHSHTHTEAYPSPTDVAAAPDPAWHYLIVTLKREKPEARTFRIVQDPSAGSSSITAPISEISLVVR